MRGAGRLAAPLAGMLAGVLALAWGSGVAGAQSGTPPGPPATAPGATPFAARTAARLLRERLSCLGCHRLQGEGGVLAPSLDDVRTRRDAGYIAAMVLDPQRVKPGALMPRPRLLASERALVIRYLGGEERLAGQVPAGVPVAAASAPGGAPDGAALYRQWCVGCHGAAGGGDGPNAKSLPVAPAKHNDGAKMSQRSDDALYDTIDGGGAIMNRSARMPAFGGTLAPAEMRALVRHIRALCRCAGPTWSRDGGR